MLGRPCAFRLDKRAMPPKPILCVCSHHHIAGSSQSAHAHLAQVGIPAGDSCRNSRPPTEHSFHTAELGGWRSRRSTTCGGRQTTHLQIGLVARPAYRSAVGRNGVGGCPRQFHAGLLLFLRQHSVMMAKLCKYSSAATRPLAETSTSWEAKSARHVERRKNSNATSCFAFWPFPAHRRGLPGTLETDRRQTLCAIPAELCQ